MTRRYVNTGGRCAHGCDRWPLYECHIHGEACGICRACAESPPVLTLVPSGATPEAGEGEPKP